MKKLFIISFLLLGPAGWSQNTEKENLQSLIENFFEAFHVQDSTRLKSFAHPDIKMQSVAIDAEGNTELSTSEYSHFLKSISSIPTSTKFEEKLHDFDININGMIANVSTPYSFYVNDDLSHCGVNTFQLMKLKGEWKIIYLVDTRSKSGCK
ncbi:3-methyl-2-oxobutanoate hydroxymethyltransferase [Salegentibacter salinarum]|uniref:3-methyl-2-oxobutanoate hydroxymethyltransferase n=1 Tax=Salegentibacter salinarum TaxID=447422 RepID=A0A2N0TQ36_9FLAO|nr:nuclear transport factor 2 family protein [Salegentibacter salinarum]PKD16834.1 3-methyl-2-oxobutanoate hydroxymethyltransferase [Salegentibacter salinarum]SKB60645.1 Putative lumazine-binding [Salegentibacter salinarum]